MNCPKCNTVAEADQIECSACGILFSKWQEREENVASGNMNRYMRIATATSNEFNWTILAIVCLAVVGAFYLFSRHLQS